MGSKAPPQADQLARVAQEEGELFHDGDVPYADVVIDEPVVHHEVVRLRSRSFRTWLAGRYWRAMGMPARGQALADAVDLLAAVALFDGPGRLVGLRIAEYHGAIYLDLGDDRWRVVEVDMAGWRILDRSPVPFRRPRGLLSLPLPVAGGSLDELRGFINVADDEQFRLLGGWLLAAFRTRGPYICLVLGGEQDSAKSTTARVLRLLVDPNAVGDRTLPRDEQSMAISASNSWIASFDNVSTLADWQSDAIARLATGAGFSTRQLYSDDEEFLVYVARPVILNGIGAIVIRPDLMDRAIAVDLATIPDEQRRPEEEFWRAFEVVRPRILGALLTAVSIAYGHHDEVRIQGLPRMADATRWVTAAEGVLRWPAGSFLAAYRRNRTNSRALTLEASPIGAPIAALMTDREDWSGTATELLKALEQRVEDAVARRRDWPKTPALLGTALRRVAPDLRRVELIDVQFPNRHGKDRIIRLVRVGESLSQPSREVPARDTGDSDSRVRTEVSTEPARDLVAEAIRIFGDELTPPGGPV